MTKRPAHWPAYKRWASMIDRCHNPRCPAYKWYGARGVSVCDEWRGSFDAYMAYVGDRPTPKHSLDRIDVNGNYEPGNVRWATWSEQRMNTRQQAKRTTDAVAGKWWKSKRARAMATIDEIMAAPEMRGWTKATAYRRLGSPARPAGRRPKP